MVKFNGIEIPHTDDDVIEYYYDDAVIYDENGEEVIDFNDLSQEDQDAIRLAARDKLLEDIAAVGQVAIPWPLQCMNQQCRVRTTVDEMPLEDLDCPGCNVKIVEW